MIRVYDFKCAYGHTHEAFVRDENVLVCHCGAIAHKQLSTPRVLLEGTTGAFPGAAAKWEQQRAQKQAIQQRKEADHGDRGWTS